MQLINQISQFHESNKNAQTALLAHEENSQVLMANYINPRVRSIQHQIPPLKISKGSKPLPKGGRPMPKSRLMPKCQPKQEPKQQQMQMGEQKEQNQCTEIACIDLERRSSPSQLTMTPKPTLINSEDSINRVFAQIIIERQAFSSQHFFEQLKARGISLPESKEELHNQEVSFIKTLVKHLEQIISKHITTDYWRMDPTQFRFLVKPILNLKRYLPLNSSILKKLLKNMYDYQVLPATKNELLSLHQILASLARARDKELSAKKMQWREESRKPKVKRKKQVKHSNIREIGEVWDSDHDELLKKVYPLLTNPSDVANLFIERFPEYKHLWNGYDIRRHWQKMALSALRQFQQRARTDPECSVSLCGLNSYLALHLVRAVANRDIQGRLVAFADEEKVSRQFVEETVRMINREVEKYEESHEKPSRGRKWMRVGKSKVSSNNTLTDE